MLEDAINSLFAENTKQTPQLCEIYAQMGKRVHYRNIEDESSVYLAPINGMSLSMRHVGVEKFAYAHSLRKEAYEKMNTALISADRSMFLKPTHQPQQEQLDVSSGDICKMIKEIKGLTANYNTKSEINVLSYDYDIYALNNRNGARHRKDSYIYLAVKYHINDAEYTFRRVLFDYEYDKATFDLHQSIKNNYENSTRLKSVSFGEYDLVLGSGQPAILFHECCGHLCEIGKSSKEYSPFNSRLKETIASPFLTLFDDDFKLRQKLEFDDEGSEKKNTKLIDGGVLSCFLTDLYGAESFNCEHTGNSRRESFEFLSEARMCCTYVDNGHHSPSDILASTGKGIYVEKMSDSYVNLKTGEVIATIEEGYLISNGKLESPVRNCIVKGNALNILKNVEAIGNDLSFSQAACVSNSGHIYVEVGQPTVKIEGIKAYSK